MSEDWQSKPGKASHQARRFVIYVALLVLAFLLGLVPTWLTSRVCSGRLANAERQSRRARLENSLASAAIAARRGDYETARQDASDFFTVLQTETNNGVDSALSEAEIAGLQPLLIRRDEIITLLAQSNPAAVGRLTDLYGLYREIMNR